MMGSWPYRFLVALPWVILALGAGETWFAWSSAQRLAFAALEREFDSQIAESVLQIEGRLRANEQALRGLAGLYANDRGLSREGFRTYVEGLHLAERFPGILGVGLSLQVPARSRAAHMARIRREGFPDYAIWPPGERDPYSAIVFLEPFTDRNLRAFGYDMLSEPVRQAAMVWARDTGNTAMSGKIRLVQETEIAPQAGFLIYVPIYRIGAPVGTTEQRRGALLGWAYSPLRMEDMMRNMMGGQLARFEGAIRLCIYDGESAEAENLLFDSDPTRGKPEAARFRQDRLIGFGGRPWTISGLSLPAFDRRLDGKARIIAVAGAALTILLALLAWALMRGQRGVAAALEQAKEANRALQENQTLLQLIYDTSDVAIFLVDLAGRITHANRCMEDMFGLPAERLIGSEYVSHTHPDERDEARARMLALLRSDVAFVEVDRLYWREDGSQFWGHLRGRRVVDAQGRAVGLVGVISDIDERRRLQADLERQARTDSLTGVNNRRHFLELAEAEINRALRYRSSLSVLMIDVDFFKDVNDTHGHAAGDQVLCRLTDVCRAGLRETDPVGRIGGEEFAVLLPETDLVGAQDVAERLRASVAATAVSRADGPDLRFTVSIGVASFQQSDGSLDGLLRAADDGLYMAKRGGRNRVCTCQSAENPA
jgi:diguanylate cyclase (GGDEF)-like protein/PAS domain S-box-containing protein